MGRVYDTLDIDGRQCWTLFDTGSRNTYVVREALGQLPTMKLKRPKHVGLGGALRDLTELVVLEGSIQGCSVETHAYVLDELAPDEQGKPIEVIFGALAMQQWGIRPLPDEERLDLSRYSSEWVEY